MKIKDAAEMLTAMAQLYPDFHLSVYADGKHHTTKLLFFAIAPSLPGTYAYQEKEEKKALSDEPIKKRFGKVPAGVYDDPPF